MKNNTYDRWWLMDDHGEDSMEINHHFHWQKIVSYLDPADFTNKTLLDFGCNQGGLLRYLYDTIGFKEGFGIDLGTDSIKTASSRSKGYPVTYMATGCPSDTGKTFDTAISSAVIYLIKDLEKHAKLMADCLKPGGVYYITYSDYVRNPNLPKIFKTINTYGSLSMNLHSLKDIAQAFLHENFQVSLLRMQPTSFVPLSAEDTWNLRIEERMDYEYTQCYLFKCVKQK